MENKPYAHLNKIATISLVVSIILFCFGLFVIPFIGILTSFCLFLYASWIKTDNRTKNEYRNFCLTKDIQFGTPIERVEEIMDSYFLLSVNKSKSAPQEKICKTCGGKVVDGECQYCHNKYDDSSDVTRLNYSSKYGTQSFIFKHGKLDNVETDLLPLNQFLILNF